MHNRPIEEIAAALGFTRGHFAATAKLLDMRLNQIKSIVNYRPELAKWRKAREGRPKGEKLGFTIKPFEEQPGAADVAEIIGNWKLANIVVQLGRAEARRVLEEHFRSLETQKPAPTRPAGG